MATEKWVKGNTLHLVVPLQLVSINEGQEVTTDYYPPEGSEIHVKLQSQYVSKTYDCEVDGNRVKFTDDGSLSSGLYGIEVKVKEPTGLNRRTFKCGEIQVVNCTDELGDLPDGEMVLDAAIYIQGEKGDKGDKGDPFTYEDFTPEQIADLQRPATEAADTLITEVRQLEREMSANEQGRVEAEQTRQQAEVLRSQSEQDRVSQETQRNTKEQERISNEQTRNTNEEGRLQAEVSRSGAENTRQQNEQTRISNEQQREETFAGYQPILDRYDERLDALEITGEQFHEIFND